MLFIVAISIALILIIVLFYKFIGVDRGVDKYKENVNAVVIGKEPYVSLEQSHFLCICPLLCQHQ